MKAILLLVGIIAASRASPTIQERQLVDEYCISNGSICSFFSTLYDDCNNKFDALTFLNKFNVCYCGNGGVAAQIGCHECETSFGESELSNPDYLSSQCESVSATIAPLPSSLMSEWAQFNATFTGNKPSGFQGGIATASPAGSSMTADFNSSVTSSAAQGASLAVTSMSPFGNQSTSSGSLASLIQTGSPSTTVNPSQTSFSSSSATDSSTAALGSFTNAAAASTSSQSSTSSGDSMGEHRSALLMLVAGALILLRNV